MLRSLARAVCHDAVAAQWRGAAAATAVKKKAPKTPKVPKEPKASKAAKAPKEPKEPKVAAFCASSFAMAGSSPPKGAPVTAAKVRKAIHPLTKKTLTFDDNYHSYLMGGKRLRSVTSLLRDKLQNEAGEVLPPVGHPFDAKGIAARIAESQGKEPEEVLAEWQAVTDYGTRLHSLIHSSLTGGDAKPENDRESRYMEQCEAYLSVLSDFGYKVVPGGSEMMLAAPEWGVAGTADALFRCKKGNAMMSGDHYLLLDWKANAKALRPQTPFPGSPQTLNWPFEDLPATKLAEYGLQTNCYRVLLQTQGYLRPEDKVLMAVTQFYENGLSVEYDAIKVPEVETSRIIEFFTAATRMRSPSRGKPFM